MIVFFVFVIFFLPQKFFKTEKKFLVSKNEKSKKKIFSDFEKKNSKKIFLLAFQKIFIFRPLAPREPAPKPLSSRFLGQAGVPSQIQAQNRVRLEILHHLRPSSRNVNSKCVDSRESRAAEVQKVHPRLTRTPKSSTGVDLAAHFSK